jgi:hypothetical protein
MQAIELETEIDENHEIRLKLPEAIRARKARVVVLYDDTESETVRDVPTQQDAAKPSREFGQFRGQIWMSDDFDAPLPDDFWLGGHP